MAGALRAAGCGVALALGAAAAAAAPPALHLGGDVIYQIVTDRFKDGDPRNNPAPPRFSADCQASLLYCGGDWAGIAEVIRSGYFRELGVTALQISVPMQNTPIVQAKNGAPYHGYWLYDMKRPEPAFGSWDDFRALVHTAHGHGLKLLIDIVINQGGPLEHGLLRDDGRLLADARHDPEGRLHPPGEADYTRDEDMLYRSLYDLVDLNQHHPRINRYLREMTRLWLDTGIDGLRVDTVKHVSLAWQRSWLQEVYRHRPVYAAGEWYAGRNDWLPENFRFANDSGMHVLDFPVSQRVRQVFRYRERSLIDLATTMDAAAQAYRRPLDQVLFIDNHDQNRHTLSDAAEHRRLTEQALAFILTARGVPSLYYGTEHYQLGAGHAPVNRPLMATWQRDTPAFGLISRLAALRRQHPALQFGSQRTRWVTPEVYVFEREFAGSVVRVALNRDSQQAAEVPETATALPCGAAPLADVLAGQFGGPALPLGCHGRAGAFTLPPGAIAVWAGPLPSAATPTLGHAGPPLVSPGGLLTLAGRGFGTRKGRVWVGPRAVAGAQLLSWTDQAVTLRLPAGRSGALTLQLERADGQRSELLRGAVDRLGERLATLRLVVDAPPMAADETLWVDIAPAERRCNAGPERDGPFYNRVLYQAPTWYRDLSVPAGCRLTLRAVKRGPSGEQQAAAPWQLRVPRQDLATARVRIRHWLGTP